VTGPSTGRLVRRLLCFAGAGALAAPYRAWQREFPPDVEAWPVELDHGDTDVPSLLDALEPVVWQVSDSPYALFGHSFGALLAYELARRTTGRGRPPVALGVSACAAPYRFDPRRDGGATWWEELPDSFGAESDRTAGERARLAAAFTLADGYSHRPGPPLACPISAFGGFNDRSVDRADLAAWESMTTASFRLRMLPGSHQLVHEMGPHIARALGRDLRWC
jgi:medium-chain acyl-[acyl-carrier-protein] hydrolase